MTDLAKFGYNPLNLHNAKPIGVIVPSLCILVIAPKAYNVFKPFIIKLS